MRWYGGYSCCKLEFDMDNMEDLNLTCLYKYEASAAGSEMNSTTCGISS